MKLTLNRDFVTDLMQAYVEEAKSLQAEEDQENIDRVKIGHSVYFGGNIN